MENDSDNTPVPADVVAAPKNVDDVGLLLFFSVLGSVARFSMWAAEQIILTMEYGHTKVAREHLHVIKWKPEWVISNGDVLWEKGFEHYLISVAMWIVMGIALLVLTYHKALPGSYSDSIAANETRRQSVGIGLIGVPICILLVVLSLPLSLLLGAITVTCTLAWAWRTEHKRCAAS